MSCFMSAGSLACAALLLVAAPLRAGTIKVPKDHDTIQAAVNAAALGDTVAVSKGVYRENVTVGTQITLKGSGAIIDGSYAGDCLTISTAGVTVTGFTLRSGGGSPVTGGLLVENLGATLSKLTISGCEAYGIRMLLPGTIQSCRIEACPGTGILVELPPPDPSVITAIEKNTVTGCGVGMLLLSGPYRVAGNTVELCNAKGIEVNLEAGVLPSEISKNKCIDNQGTGLTVASLLTDTTAAVEKNTCTGNSTGLHLQGQNLVATSNTCNDNVRAGILLEAGACTVEKNKVQGNGQVGIVLQGGTANDLIGNTVQGNGGDGIDVGSTSSTLESNTIKDNAGDGIEIGAVAGNNLVKNTLQNNDHDGIDNSGSETVITGNKVKGSGGMAIAGAGTGGGTVNLAESVDNVVDDDSNLDGFTTLSLLDLETISSLP